MIDATHAPRGTMSTGWEQRLEILRRDADAKILQPLRSHDWTIHHVHEVEAGEYLLVDFERASLRRKVALLYSSATGNDVYKRLALQVDHILVHGQLWKLESYAYGIDKPVSTLDDFHSLLLEWNAASAPGKFAPSSGEPMPAAPPKHRTLLAEAPIEAIWLRLRQLQSVTLARKVVEARARDAGEPLESGAVATKAEGIAFALRNAIDYYQIGGRSNVSQRVLNLYYGTLAFAFAEMLSSPAGVATLAQIEDATKLGHGLYTFDGPDGGLGDLRVGVIASGFFPAWTKTMGIGLAAWPQKKPRAPADLQGANAGTWLTVEHLFGRIPELGDLFSDIFDSKPGWVTPAYDTNTNQPPSLFRKGAPASPRPTTYALLIDDTARLTRDDIAAFRGPISQITEVASEGAGRHFRVAVDHPGRDVWWDALAIHRSPFERHALILPAFGGVTEYRALCLALLYALSIVVRYRPSIWRRVQEGDLDHVRVLIEAFLSVVERVLPEQFLERVSGQKVFVHQPGALF